MRNVKFLIALAVCYNVTASAQVLLDSLQNQFTSIETNALLYIQRFPGSAQHASGAIPVWRLISSLGLSGVSTGGITGLTGDVSASGPGVAGAIINPGSVTSPKIAAGAVGVAHILDLNVTESKIADRNVTDGKIQYSTVGKISAAGTITFDFNGARRQTNAESGTFTIALANVPTGSVDREIIAQFLPATGMTLTWPTTVGSTPVRWLQSTNDIVNTIGSNVFTQVSINYNGVEIVCRNILKADLSGVPAWQAFDPTDFDATIGVPGLVKVNSSIARTESPSFTGVATAETISPNLATLNPWDLGVITNGGTATLVANYNYYLLTNNGSYTIAIPVGMPDCTALLEGISTSAIDPAIITLPNSAVWTESGSQTPVSSFTVDPNSSAKYDIALVIANGTVTRVHAAGVQFPSAITASQVSFSPSAGVISTDLQSLGIELASKKADLTNLAAVATSGSYGDLTGTPPLATAVTVYASGTGYTLTATPAELNFGGTDPFIVISQAGSYLISGRATVEYVGATCTNQTVTLKFRRTNNTAADVANSSKALKLENTTTQTGVFVDSPLSSVGYTTANTDDRITIYADVSSLPTAGSILVSAASLQILRISGWSVYDGTPPTVTSATIDTNGTSLTINHDETVTFGAGGNGGFAITPSGGAATLTYNSGSGSSALVYALSRTIATNETATLAYTQPGSGVEDLSGNDLASFSGTNVVNNSWQSGFVPFTAAFDGADYITDNSVLVGFGDAKTVTWSGWVKFTSGNGTNQNIYWNNATRFQVMRTNDNTLRITGANVGGTTILDISTTSTLTTTNGWVHVLAAFDMNDPAKRHIYFNGSEQATNVLVYTNAAIDLTSGTVARIGAGAAAGNKFTGEMCEFWLANRYLTDNTKFEVGNKPISLGSTGELPDGSAPAIYLSLSGDANSWANDSSGNGNNFTVTGTLGTGTPP